MRDFPIIDNNISVTPRVVANTANTVTISNTGASMSVTNLTSFTMYDDDDFNNNDGTNKDGDAGENVTAPDIGMLQNSDIPCIDSYMTPACNVLATSYVKPIYDLTSHYNEVTFDLHNSPTELSTIVSGNDFGQKGTQAEPDFWTVYLLGGYQAEENQEGDPNSLFNSMGMAFATAGTLGRVDMINGSGAIVYMESARPGELMGLNPPITNWQTLPLGQKFTAAHEIGHLFSLEHIDYDSAGDAWLMTQTSTRTKAIFNEVQRDKIRDLAHP